MTQSHYLTARCLAGCETWLHPATVEPPEVVTGPISMGGRVNRTPRAASRSYSPATSSTAKDVNGIPSCTSAVLNGATAGWSLG